MRPTVAFLGPEGTFTAEAAALAAPEAARSPQTTIPEVFAAVRSGRADLGVVPIENLIEGSVNATLDELAFGGDGVRIRGEVLVPISMSLLARPGSALEDLTEVRSHPHALAQCRAWLAAHLPDVTEHAATSTAEAARQVAAGDDAGCCSGAIGTRAAAQRYALEVLATDIHDRLGNLTRFAVLGTRMHHPTGADKTSLVVFFGEDRPGLLLRILDELALRGINLSKIESRPTKTTMGEYCILIDCDGHPAEARVAEALRSIHRHAAQLTVLGAYPRADGAAPPPASVDSDDAYAAAQRWWSAVLESIDGR